MGRNQGTTGKDNRGDNDNERPNDPEAGAAEGHNTTVRAGEEEGRGKQQTVSIVGREVSQVHGVIPDAAKRRGRPPGTTKGPGSSSSSSKAQTSTKPAGKKHDLEQTQFMISTLLVVIFNLLEKQMGPHWKLESSDATNLAEPIAAILDRHDMTKLTGSYGEYIALIAAIGMIILPKVMIQMQISKQKGANNNVRYISEAPRKPASDTGTKPASIPSGSGDQPVQAAHSGPFGNSIKSDLVPVIG